MINKREVIEYSMEFMVPAKVIEKDYALGWLLAGIASHRDLGNRWVFKGGTCLRKCYLETYRFSEGIAFTVTDPEYLAPGLLTKAFGEISEWVYGETGIEIPRNGIGIEPYKNRRGTTSVQGRIAYKGPMRSDRDPGSIRFDLTDNGGTVFPPVARQVHHPYSDEPEDGIHVRCHSLETIFAEKIRTLAERERPQDLYDLVNLYRNRDLQLDTKTLLQTLSYRCRRRGVEVPIAQFLETEPDHTELEAEWKHMAHQLPALPPFEEFWTELRNLSAWLHGAAEKIIPPKIPAMGLVFDPSGQWPPGSHCRGTPVPLEAVRFAATNRLLVNLTYQGKIHLIEPYALRRTEDGDLFLYAVINHTGEVMTYRVDRIEAAETTGIPYVPRYEIELGSFGAHSTRPAGQIGGSDSLHGRLNARSASRPIRKRGASSQGLKYVFLCPVCARRFTKETYSSGLNPHEGDSGRPCPGRVGMYMETQY
jgi:predicted nucleotidyltransferase component of viral defense system